MAASRRVGTSLRESFLLHAGPPPASEHPAPHSCYPRIVAIGRLTPPIAAQPVLCAAILNPSLHPEDHPPLPLRAMGTAAACMGHGLPATQPLMMPCSHQVWWERIRGKKVRPCVSVPLLTLFGTTPPSLPLAGAPGLARLKKEHEYMARFTSKVS